ncbi:hypothetical protein B0H17DRAFT_936705, partial [Mycena rosella]
IKWSDPRIEHVINWLETKIVDCQKLFSDSSKEAAEEGKKKRVAKGSKSVYYTVMAKAVFSVDHDDKLCDVVQMKLDELRKSIGNLRTRLKTTYKEFNAELGQTGAGLEYSNITLNNDMYNKIGMHLSSTDAAQR